MRQRAGSVKIIKPHYVDKGAVFSRDRKYRYLLWRTWRSESDPLVLAMLNPSTAHGERDDHTITKSVNFAAMLGFGGLIVVNGFGLRATDPRDLLSYSGDRVGFWNYDYLHQACAGRHVVVGWGAWGVHPKLGPYILAASVAIKKSKPKNVYCFGRTKEGAPRHPLMLPYSTPLREYGL